MNADGLLDPRERGIGLGKGRHPGFSRSKISISLISVIRGPFVLTSPGVFAENAECWLYSSPTDSEF